MILFQLLQIAHGWLHFLAIAARAATLPLSIISRVVRASLASLAKLVEVAR